MSSANPADNNRSKRILSLILGICFCLIALAVLITGIQSDARDNERKREDARLAWKQAGYCDELGDPALNHINSLIAFDNTKDSTLVEVLASADGIPRAEVRERIEAVKCRLRLQHIAGLVDNGELGEAAKEGLLFRISGVKVAMRCQNTKAKDMNHALADMMAHIENQRAIFGNPNLRQEEYEGAAKWRRELKEIPATASTN